MVAISPLFNETNQISTIKRDYQVERKALQSIYLAKKDNSFPLIQNVTGDQKTCI